MLPNFKLSSAGNCALPQMYVAVLVRKSQGSREETEHSTRESGYSHTSW
jgi:hypothetical protein